MRDFKNFNEYNSYFMSALRSVFFTDASYSEENNLQGLVESEPTESCLLLLEVGEKYNKFDIHEPTLRKRLNLNLTGRPKLGGNLTDEQEQKL
jgi:hypothetical protein